MFSGVSWTRWLLVAAIVPMSACAGGDEPSVLGPEDGAAEEAGVTEEVVPAASSSTLPPVTTVAPAGTEAPSTTAAAGDATTTTVAAGGRPSIGDAPVEILGDFISPDDPELLAVVDAAKGFIAAAIAATANPDDEALRQNLLAHTDEGLGGRFVLYLNDLVANGERVVPQPETRFVVIASSVETYGDSATFEVCVVDADHRVRTQAGAGGSDVVVDDALVSGVQTYQFVRDTSRWLMSEYKVSTRVEGRDVCG